MRDGHAYLLRMCVSDGKLSLNVLLIGVDLDYAHVFMTESERCSILSDYSVHRLETDIGLDAFVFVHVCVLQCPVGPANYQSINQINEGLNNL